MPPLADATEASRDIAVVRGAPSGSAPVHPAHDPASRSATRHCLRRKVRTPVRRDSTRSSQFHPLPNGGRNIGFRHREARRRSAESRPVSPLPPAGPKTSSHAPHGGGRRDGSPPPDEAQGPKFPEASGDASMRRDVEGGARAETVQGECRREEFRVRRRYEPDRRIGLEPGLAGSQRGHLGSPDRPGASSASARANRSRRTAWLVAPA